MTTDTTRVHRAVSLDGTEIAGRVQGGGPPLVLVHGAMACGETEWPTLLPHLVDHFTCHTPSTRCRGLSGSSDDLRRSRLAEDVVAYVESIPHVPGAQRRKIPGAGHLGPIFEPEAVAAELVEFLEPRLRAV